MQDVARDLRHAAVQRLHATALGSHLDSLVEYLAELGYLTSSIRRQLLVLSDLDRWMTSRRLRVADLRESIVTTFLDDRARKGCLHRCDAAAVDHFLTHLRAHGATAAAAPAILDDAPVARLQRDYEHYLRSERGLAMASLPNYCQVCRSFLAEHVDGGRLALEHVDGSTVATFVCRRATSLSRGRAKILVTGLRSLLRFLLQRGLIDRDLAVCVPAVADWRLATIPKSLTPDDIEQVLNACDRTTALGRRDHAILLLLARLGLRAGEVVRLQLDDLHWRTGEITVRGSKTRRQDRLPLLIEVGEALATYVHRDRSGRVSRRVFLCGNAPSRGLAGPSSVTTIVRRALHRAGLQPPVRGAHVLRHSLATTLLRQGASLSEIGQVLRHRSVDTTAIYAKVDVAALRALAQSWPEGGGGR